ncbi:MAG: hypothetical protein OIN66_16000 [Candidatus Methanoperedens sp.]|nr:hypothetical protein [Candidatus Methanoperedens sp.]
MKRVLFISGIIIFAIGGFFFMAGYNGIQELALKFTIYSQEAYQQYKTMEIAGGISAVIGILIALAGIFEKNDH